MVKFFISLTLFLVLDWIWFSLFMKQFAKDQLKGFLRFSGDNIDVNIFAAAAAYICMAISVSVFLSPYITGESLIKSLGYSFLLGFIVFGILIMISVIHTLIMVVEVTVDK